jgi:rhodanese-related sulfurtransferase
MENMSKLDFFKAKLEATISPMEFMKRNKANPNAMVVVDVRNGSPKMKGSIIVGALQIPQNEIANRLSELPKDKIIVVYCWDVFCSLAAKAAITLLENGFDVMELSGGIAAWNKMKFPTQSLE